MIQGAGLTEPTYKLFIDASVKYADKIEQLALAVESEQPVQAKLLRVLADEVAQSATLVLRFWPDKKIKKVDTGGI